MNIKRLAVAVMFFMNGMIYANWVARLPEIQELYGFSNSMLGTLLLCNAFGAVTAMPFSGWFITRFGSRKISAAMAIFFCIVFPLIPIMPSKWVLFPVFVAMGVCGGAMDVSMNGQAVFVERMLGKPIMSSFHAVFSGAMFLGAMFGSYFAKVETPLFTHFALVAAGCFVISGWAIFNLVNDEEHIQAAGADTEGGGFRLPTKAILPLGIIAFCGMTGEGAMADWAAIYLNKVVGENASVSAYGVGAFAWAMFIGRAFGDFLTKYFGKRKLLIISCFLAIGGLSLSLSVVQTWVVLTGFFCVGLAIANVVPIIYSTAGNTEGVAPSVGIAMATTVGYAGFFVGPPVIGYMADVWNLRIALVFVVLLFTVMLGIVVRHRALK